jgi:hypothetical protein
MKRYSRSPSYTWLPTSRQRVCRRVLTVLEVGLNEFPSVTAEWSHESPLTLVGLPSRELVVQYTILTSHILAPVGLVAPLKATLVLGVGRSWN